MFQKFLYSSAGETNRGLVRDYNEDAFSIFESENFFVAAVADGVSCQGHGAVASSLCCQTWRDCAEKTAPDFDATGKTIETFLRDTLAASNAAVLKRNAADRIESETTLCALCLAGKYAGLIHAGDSRVYRLRDGKLQLLTQDHTLVEKYFLEHGCFPENQEKYAGMIYRAVGAHPTLEGDVKIVDAGIGDRFLLCSDGLYRQMDFDEIESILKNNDTASRAVDRLMRAGFIGGADDNLTAAVVYIQAQPV